MHEFLGCERWASCWLDLLSNTLDNMQRNDSSLRSTSKYTNHEVVLFKLNMASWHKGNTLFYIRKKEEVYINITPRYFSVYMGIKGLTNIPLQYKFEWVLPWPMLHLFKCHEHQPGSFINPAERRTNTLTEQQMTTYWTVLGWDHKTVWGATIQPAACLRVFNSVQKKDEPGLACCLHICRPAVRLCIRKKKRS